MTLETLPGLTHERCAFKIETLFQDGSWHGHQSVTEVELCADYYSAQEFEQAGINAQWEIERRDVAEESFRVAGPLDY